MRRCRWLVVVILVEMAFTRIDKYEKSLDSDKF